jgi:hypothetical protein
MFDVWSVSGQASTTLFFVVWVVVGKYTLLSLFLAVIMEAFETAQNCQESAQLDLELSNEELQLAANKLVTALRPASGLLLVNGLSSPCVCQ